MCVDTTPLGQLSKNPPKLRLKISWNLRIILVSAMIWQVFNMKHTLWPETEAIWKCWNLHGKTRETTWVKLMHQLKIEAEKISWKRKRSCSKSKLARKSRLNMSQFIKWFLRIRLGNQVQTCFLKRKNSDWKAFCVCFGQWSAKEEAENWSPN